MNKPAISMRVDYKWALVALLWVVALLNYVDRQIIFSVLPLIQRELLVSNFQLGLLGTSFLWVYAVLSPLGGYVADRFGRRAVILMSLLVWSAVTLLTGYAHGYGELVVARGLMGISEACYLPAALALIADYHSTKTRSRATGLHQSGLYAGIALGGGGGWMGDRYGWRPAFLILGGIGIAYAIVVAVFLKDAPPSPTEPRQRVAFLDAMRELLQSRPFLLLVGVNTLVGVVYWCVYTWLALYLFERFQMSLTRAGFSSTFYIQVASFCGILLGGYIGDRWSQVNPRGKALTQAIGLAAAGPALYLAGAAGSQSILLPCLVLFGLGRGFFDCNLMPVACQLVSPRLRASAYGVLNCTAMLAGGAMAAAGGILKDTIGLGGALQLSAALLIVAAVGMWALRMDVPVERKLTYETH